LYFFTHWVATSSYSIGSKHNPYEQACAEKLCEHYDVEFIQIDLTAISQHLQSNLLKSGGDIPEGYYSDESMVATVVPGRNTIFMSILIGIAQTRNASIIACGIHSGDHAIYPDCRPAFFYAMDNVTEVVTENKVTMVAPFLYGNKESILEWGFENGVPYELTRTCYKDQEKSCGKCGSCVERLEAFAAHVVEDPIEYEEVATQ